MLLIITSILIKVNIGSIDNLMIYDNKIEHEKNKFYKLHEILWSEKLC